MSNLTKPPILDETGQDILSALADIKRNLPHGGGSNGYAPTDATEATLADDDKVPFYDTSASGKRNSTWANIKAKLKAYFDTVYATISDLVSKADNVSVSAKIPSGYGAYGIPKFSQYTGISTDLENLPDVVDDISEALYDSINAHGDLFSSISAQSKGTYNNKTYNSTLHEFDVVTVETDKTAVYMAGDINTKLGNAINDHAAAMIKSSYPQSIYDDTTHKMATLTPSLSNATPIDMIDNIQTALEDAVDDHADLIGKLRVEKTLAEFNALTPAEQDDPEIVYYIPDKPSLGYPVQDDGTATDLTDGALATGRTIESWGNNRYVQKAWTKKTVSLTNTALNSLNTLSVPELANADEVIIRVKNLSSQQHYYRLEGDNVANIVNYDGNSAIWNIQCNVICYFSNNSIGLITHVKGASQPYPIIDAVFYR